MPDRKLPVVYVVVGEDGEYCFSAGSRETAETYLAMNDVPECYSGQRESLVTYDPPIPRCRTCDHFGEDVDLDASPIVCNLTKRTVPCTGLGYCWEHSEAKR